MDQDTKPITHADGGLGCNIATALPAARKALRPNARDLAVIAFLNRIYEEHGLPGEDYAEI